MKIIVNKNACAGHVRCNLVAPALFELDDNGYIAITELDVPPEQEAIARRGANACPEQVIQIVEDADEGSAT